MNSAIIETGNFGGALAKQLIKAGHAVFMSAKFPFSWIDLVIMQLQSRKIALK